MEAALAQGDHAEGADQAGAAITSAASGEGEGFDGIEHWAVPCLAFQQEEYAMALSVAQDLLWAGHVINGGISCGGMTHGGADRLSD